jgi:hypothetical protein
MKASKFCNLRCQYCYEFPELDDKTAMSIEQLKHGFEAIARLFGGSDRVMDFVWHGGEPLLQAPEFYAELESVQKLCRLVASFPPPRFHTVKYAGVLAPASPWRERIGPRPAKPEEPAKADDEPVPKRKRGGYRPWAELLRRTLAIDVLECPTCKGRMKLIAMITEPKSVARFLAALGEPVDVPGRSPSAHVAPAVLEEHRPAPQGARRRRVAARRSTAGLTPPSRGRRVPTARKCACSRAPPRAPRPSGCPKDVAVRPATPPGPSTAPRLVALRSGFFHLRAA